MTDGGGIVERALSSLGKGFDITSDFRLKFCKGKERLVLINEDERRDLMIPGFGIFEDVSVDIKCDKGDRSRCQSDVLGFNQMSEYFNQRSSLAGKIPSGLFNVMFGFSGSSWAHDASVTKSLAVDGFFITLFNLHIDRYPLLLSDEVTNAIPTTWDPSALARFIENYGTHIIVGLEIGGQDVVLVRQDKSSTLQPSDLKKHLDELGDQLFTGTCNLSFSPRLIKTKESPRHIKIKAPEAFDVFSPQPVLLDSFSSITAKDGIMVMCSKRGGDPAFHSHCEWLLTVPQRPGAINFRFIPICSLLKNVPGKGLLSHAINLYLRYKPPIADLQYLLDFQAYKSWAPFLNDLPLGPATNRGFSNTCLQLNIIGPKLYVNTDQVIVGRSPVTGMRLYLEGMKCNRLAIHLQHLTSTPTVLQNKLGEPFKWRNSDEIAGDDRFFEPILWKKFSHVCTAPVRYDPAWATREDAVFIVTGARLVVKQYESKDVLHLCLLFSEVSNAVVARSLWQQGPSNYSQKSRFFSVVSSSSVPGNLEKQKEMPMVIDSGEFPRGPPVQSQKLTKFVDVSELCKGPQDCPGYWIVTGAKLDLEKGKICLNVKFSLLCFS